MLSISDKIILSPIWALSLLPLPVLYGISDFLSWVMCYIIPYRRKVVLSNLQHAFPEKEQHEIRHLARRFYRYLCDFFMESIYLVTMDLEECNRRYTYQNPELLQQLYKEGKNLAIATSHFGNWEWATNFESVFSHKLYGIYKPLKNKLFDRLFITIRNKYGSLPIPMKQTLRTIMDCTKKKEIFALYFVADQRPRKNDLTYWTTFMNQKTPLITGMDRLARKYDLTVIFMNIERPRRGYYQVSHEIIEAQPAASEPNSISEKYIRCVEAQIRRNPELYLWSHKRWKYRAEDYINKEGRA